MQSRRGRDTRQQLLQHLAQIANQRHIDLDVFVDFGGVDFDVNLFGLERVGRGGSSHAIVKAHAAGDEQIGFLNGVVYPCLAVHAHHAQVERVRCGKSAEAQQRERNGNLRALSQRVNLLHGPRLDHAVAGKDHRALGIANEFCRLRQT